jgi:hypothetical protein
MANSFIDRSVLRIANILSPSPISTRSDDCRFSFGKLPRPGIRSTLVRYPSAQNHPLGTFYRAISGLEIALQLPLPPYAIQHWQRRRDSKLRGIVEVLP